MLPKNFEDILNAPSFLINLDRCIERWPIMKERLENAEFIPTRWSAIDGAKGHCKKQWYEFGIQSNAIIDFDSDGQAACALSHAHVWEYIVKNNIPFANIFEDDILFHKDWNTLAPEFYKYTNKNTDIIFYGSQGGATPQMPMITQMPVFCLHAYLITLEGAKKLLAELKAASRVFVIDCFTIELMKIPHCPFTWECWNGTSYDDPARNTTLVCRNEGLVYQDDSFSSNIHCHAPPELKD